jgi:hypothetical protein
MKRHSDQQFVNATSPPAVESPTRNKRKAVHELSWAYQYCRLWPRRSVAAKAQTRGVDKGYTIADSKALIGRITGQLPVAVRKAGFSSCMVRRRVASEKRSMAVGLRQCIRPSVESVTPGHDGYPLAFVLINWTASKRPLPISGFQSVGETHGHLYFPPADLAGTLFP